MIEIQVLGEAGALTMLARRPPSPLPSPPGRGRIVGRLSTILGSWRASTFSYAHLDHEPDDRVSLSPGERVGVRGNSASESLIGLGLTYGSWKGRKEISIPDG